MTALIESYGPSLAAFGLFGLLHSAAAQEPFKQALAKAAGAFFVDHFWRLVYCGLSFAALYWGVAALHWNRNPDLDAWLVVYPDWLWALLTLVHLGSIAVIYAAFLQSDYLEFLGFKQAWRGLCLILGQSDVPPLELFGTHRLVVTGVYRWVRHPMMAAGLWFLLTSGPSTNNIIYAAMYAAYMFIGGYFEDRRLGRVFGDEYLLYRQRVGAFFPRLSRNR